MAIALTDADHVLFDRFIKAVLDGTSDPVELQEAFAHVFTQLAADDEGFRAHMEAVVDDA